MIGESALLAVLRRWSSTDHLMMEDCLYTEVRSESLSRTDEVAA